ncbi:MAG: hypothetical protein ACFB5Z_18275 [Elainellaceae cyanobacterium]
MDGRRVSLGFRNACAPDAPIPPRTVLPLADFEVLLDAAGWWLVGWWLVG